MSSSMWLVRDLTVIIFSVLFGIYNALPEEDKPVLRECLKLDKADCPMDEYYLSFYLYTRKTQDSPFKINEANINDAPFIPYMPLKVLIHGYTGWKDYSPNKELRPAYFDYGEYNIISLDWGPLANTSCYIEATYNVKFVGICTARFLDKIVATRSDIDPNDIHVVGFSLGAHVAGNIGRSLRLFRPQRITVLDPALPLFDDVFNGEYSAKKSDAQFMDCVHTNAGMKGKIDAVGHVDFYMNNAVVQPGCSTSDTSCSHDRAVQFFAESIATEVGFWGYHCQSILTYLIGTCTEPPENEWVLMGEHVLKSSRGIYFIQTNDKPPYAIGKKKNKEAEEAMLESFKTAVNMNPRNADLLTSIGTSLGIPNELPEYK